MPEENNEEQEVQTEEVEDNEVEADEAETEDESDEDESGEEDDDKDDKSDDIPEWAREKLTKANAEAANYRTKLREAEEKLKDAKSLEEVDALITEMRTARETAEHDLLVENVALKHDLPAEALEFLKGNTREELEASASKLMQMFDAGGARHLEGGLNPRDEAQGDTNPRKLAQQYGRGRRR